MRASTRSRTAQGVAAERAVLADLGVVADPFARGMLDRPTAVAYLAVRRLPRRVRAASLTLAGLAARVLWFDAQVGAAIGAGIGQVVVVGAGYDSRAWRCRRDGVAFFELDHGATQEDKVRRAPGPGPTYVEADLRTGSAADALRAGGLDAARPALFLAEGVTMYLDEAVVRRQLAGLASAAAPGSRLAADFLPPRGAGSGRTTRQRRLQRLARAGSGESLRLCVDRAEARALVEGAGWEVDGVASLRAVAQELVPSAVGLPVDAIDERKTVLAASLSGPGGTPPAGG